MKNSGIIFIISVLFFISQNNQSITAQEGDMGDYCNKQEKMYKSVFTGNSLYGEYGATSQLERDENFEKYQPANAFDNDIKTSWVEGKTGDGVFENLAFYTSTPGTKIGILPGYGTVKHFKLNNRVKSARLLIYEARKDANQCTGMFYKIGRLVKSFELSFKDSMEIQYTDLGEIDESSDGYIFTIHILSVHKGSKYDDTCIAEVVLQ